MNLRACLFVPGDRPERFDKAMASGADAVIVDLEDAVAPDAKESARAALAAWLDTRPPSAPGVWVRVNAADTAWFDADLAACRASGIAGIVLPKAEDAAAIAAVGALRPLMPLIESARGIARARALATLPGVLRLAFGSIDAQVDLGMRGATEDELLPLRVELVLASRLAGIGAPIDGVTTALDDAALLAADVARARRLGFGGKLCIHPKQVAAVRAGFTPGADELDWAQRVLRAAASGAAAFAVDGRMVDKPVLLRAQAIVRDAGP